MSSRRGNKVVGQPVAKLDGMALSRGGSLFCADLVPDNCLVVKMLRSPHAHARIRSLDASAAEALPGVHAVVHHKNTPRVMRTTAGQGAPEPSPYDFTTFDNQADHEPRRRVLFIDFEEIVPGIALFPGIDSRVNFFNGSDIGRWQHWQFCFRGCCSGCAASRYKDEDDQCGRDEKFIFHGLSSTSTLDRLVMPGM